MRATVAILMFLLATTLPARADTFNVSITDQLQGQVGYLAFDFLAGSPLANNSVTISSFTTNGQLGAASGSGSTSGSLITGPLTLSDTNFFNEWLQGITYGTTISFQFTTSDGAVAGGIPDNFSFYLLNSSLNPYLTSDGVANSLFSLDLNGPGSSPVSYTSTFAKIQITSAAASPVPEPASLLLALTPMLLAGCYRICSGWRL